MIGNKKTQSTGRKNPPISPAPNFTIMESYTPGMQLRFQAMPTNGSSKRTGPLRKSYNSAAADTHRL